MKKQITKFLSILIICGMVLAGFGMAVSATSGTGDASLASLEVSPGELSPEFSSDRYEYSVTVGEDCDKLLVNAQTADSGAKAVITGNSGLKAGANSVLINVTAADGVTTARYAIQVTRGEAQASGSQFGGGLASTPLIGSIPASGDGETKAPDGETPAGEGGEDLEDGEVPGSGEIPEGGESPESEETAEASGLPTESEAGGQAAGVITSAGRAYTLSVPDAALVPSGFTEAEISIGGQTVLAWQFPSDYDAAGLYLIYGTNPDGKTAFYIYDEAEGTVISAAEGLLMIGQENEISQSQLRSAKEAHQKSLRSRLMVIIGLSVVCFILLIALTASLTRRKRSEEGQDSLHGGLFYGRRRPDRDDDFYESEAGEEEGLYEDEEGFYEDEDGKAYEEEGEYEDLFEDEDKEYEDPFDDIDENEEAFHVTEDMDQKKKLRAEPEFLSGPEALEEPGAPAEPESRIEHSSSAKPEAEAAKDQPDWEEDTAPLPNLEDTGKLEPVQREAAAALVERDPEKAGPEEAGLEEADLEETDLEETDLEETDLERFGWKEADLEDTDRREPDPEDDDLEDIDLEDLDLESFVSEETPVLQEYVPDESKTEALVSETFVSEEPEPETFVSEKFVSEESEPERFAPESVFSEASASVEAPLGEPETDSLEEPEELDFEEINLENDGFEEITLEDVGPEEIQAVENLGQMPEILPEPPENEIPHPEENEERVFSLSEDAEDEKLPDEDPDEDFDLDAEFDLLDALLSDSIRSGRTEGSGRSSQRAGKDSSGKKPVNPVRDVPAKPKKK